MNSQLKKVLGIAAVAAGLGFGGAAYAVPIDTEFNFVPTTAVTCNNATLTLATSCSTGAPDLVTAIIADNTGLVSLVTVIGLTNPTPLTVGSAFTKTYTTALGTFTETLTVTSRTVGATSLGIIASGTITSTNPALDPSPVFYSAAYTQNAQGQVNFSVNNSTRGVPVPEPATLALLGVALAGLGFLRRRT